MTVNIDPKPGRWVLPLVVLGMVAFTYLFVRQLPGEGATDTTVDNGVETTTTTGTTEPGETTTTIASSPEIQAYLDAIEGYNSTLTELMIELASANGGFDARPRTVEYTDAEARFEAVAQQAAQVANEVSALIPPDELATTHPSLVTEATNASIAAEGAVQGLRLPPPDTGETRRSQIAAFETAVQAFSQEVTTARALVSGGG
jgi:hypothetical protein